MRVLRTLLAGVVPLLLAPLLQAPGALAQAPAALVEEAPGTLEVTASQEVVAPGLVLERRATLDAAGPVRSQLLRLAPGSTTRPALLQQDLSSPRTPAELATAAGAVAAVNGDFFDIDRTGTPDGPVVVGGTPLKADAAVQSAVAIAPSGTGWSGRVGAVQLQGAVTVGARTLPLAALNTRTVAPDAVALFSPAWGDGNRALTAGAGIELEVRGGRVSAVRAPGATPVPADGFVLVATGSAAAALAGTAPGTSAVADTRVRDEALAGGSGAPGGFAVGARLELVRDGRIAPIDTADPTWAALRARTAIGWTASGELLLLTVDGGTAASRGVTATETAQRMLQAGAVGAVMLDGGGSAQMVARAPGDAGVREVGAPSDGAARPVAHAIGLVTAPGTGQAGLVLRTPSPRVFPGLHRGVEAVVTDSAGAPVPSAAPLQVTAAAPDVAAVTATGTRAVLSGLRPGTTTLTARAGTATATLDVEVLAPLARLELERPVALPAAGASTDVQVLGRDAEGRSAPVDAAEVAVDADPALVQAGALPDGRLRLTARAGGPAATAVRLQAAGVSTTAGVALGLLPRTLDRLDDPGRWSASATRATAGVSRVAVDDLPGAGAALRLAYDFRGQAPGTGVAALVPSAPVPLPAGSRELGLWVRGDGGGGWLRGTLRVDGAGRPLTFAARVGAGGWQRLAVPVPEGARELALERVYLAQTDPAARAAGALDLALLQAGVPPEAPGGPDAVRDAALGPAAPTGPRTSRTAVVAGTRVQASDPSSEAALVAALRRAVAAGAQQVVLTGDVAGAGAADVAAVQAVLARELPAGAAWSWPSGTGAVGERRDLAGTRWLVRGAGGAGGVAGLAWLRDQLRTAAADPAVTGVVVVAGAQAPTAEEAALVRGWTGALRAGGKRVAVLSPAAATGAVREEEVLRVGVGPARSAVTSAGSWALVSAAADAASPPPVARGLPAGTDDGWLRVQEATTGPVVLPRPRTAR
ncbi:phosphodiester glycosidase family protein [Kineococcus sp. SYSU DK006]|uniref:phosphodiester glycosidase family protein n=1 Tax=Kineococcus sp. SYSU DK006 TaxID=3383127 RepID=UPI003D7F0A79